MGLQATSPPTSPLHRMPPYLKRKHDNLEEDDLMPPPEPQDDEGSPSPAESAKRLCVEISDDDKENSFKALINAKKSAPPPPVFASKSSSTGSSSASSSEGDENDDSGIKDINDDDFPDDEADDDASSTKPKVIVEHQPLPSIYDLQHMNDFDSGLSEDDSASEDESDNEVDTMEASPLFDPVLRGTKTPVVTPPTPKVIYNDRFWNQGSFGAQNTPPPPSAPATNTQFQFLESGNRIECAENGKSYLQLGTMNHHLPVTPVLQPKPNVVYRRPIPAFRNPTAAVRPVCDHSNCLQRKTSLCYKNQRSRMLNLSLHKLHLARQNHEGCLRRSVLICNMLRYIEDESEKDALQENHHFAGYNHNGHNGNANNANNADSYETALKDFNSAFRTTPYSSPVHPGPESPPPTSGTPATAASGVSYTSTPVATTAGTDTYETALKDFHTAFRTPYATPEPSASPSTAPAAPTADAGTEDRGSAINWGSVLSLGSQTELDPLNNNSFNAEAYSGGSAAASTSPAPSAASTATSADLDLSGHAFDDLGWKLSADDVLKFTVDEQMFVRT